MAPYERGEPVSRASVAYNHWKFKHKINSPMSSTTRDREDENWGPKVKAAFEMCILDHLLYSTLDKVHSAEKTLIVANLRCLPRHKRSIQKHEKSRDDAKVSRLKFS